MCEEALDIPGVKCIRLPTPTGGTAVWVFSSMFLKKKHGGMYGWPLWPSFEVRGYLPSLRVSCDVHSYKRTFDLASSGFGLARILIDVWGVNLG